MQNDQLEGEKQSLEGGSEIFAGSETASSVNGEMPCFKNYSRTTPTEPSFVRINLLTMRINPLLPLLG